MSPSPPNPPPRSLSNRAIIISLLLPHLLPILLLLCAVLTAIFYGIDLHHAPLTSAHAPAEWIYAEVIAFISFATCVLRFFKGGSRGSWRILNLLWDFVLVVLWAAQAGTFGGVFLSGGSSKDEDHIDDPYRGFTTSLGRMRAGVAVGLISMMLWALSFAMGVVGCCKSRRERKRERKLGSEAETRAKTLEDIEVGKVDEYDYEAQGMTEIEVGEQGGVVAATDGHRNPFADGIAQAHEEDGGEWRAEKQRQREVLRMEREMEKADEEALVGSMSILAARR